MTLSLWIGTTSWTPTTPLAFLRTSTSTTTSTKVGHDYVMTYPAPLMFLRTTGTTNQYSFVTTLTTQLCLPSQSKGRRSAVRKDLPVAENCRILQKWTLHQRHLSRRHQERFGCERQKEG